MAELELGGLAEADFIRLVNVALKNYGSLLALSRSPLANSPLIAPALVLDDTQPTVDDRGRALRVAFGWAVSRLAPAPPRYPIGVRRPFDDPTWQIPLWWRYNILRHRYIEPIHPDDLGECGAIDKLVELTGIPGVDRLYDERNRAVHDVAMLLREQICHRRADDELRRIAIESYLQDAPGHALELLQIAATFRWIFPRRVLIDMASFERLPGVAPALDYLVAQRLLLAGDSGANLLCPPALQAYLQARVQPEGRLANRHLEAARFYASACEPLRAAWHYQKGGQPRQGADLLLGAADALIADGMIEDLREVLAGFREGQLSAGHWRAVLIYLGDLCQRVGVHDEALAAYRKALKATTDPLEQARTYRRLGKLYEDDNPLRAKGYYDEAARELPPGDPEWPDLLKDRAWLSILRGEWAAAEEDLLLVLEKAPPEARRQRGDTWHALAALYRRQGQLERARSCAQQALRIREESGDLQRVADSYSGLGLIYTQMGEHQAAIHAYQETLAMFLKIGDREGTANTYVNIGAALFRAGTYGPAVERYRESLALYETLGLPRPEVEAHYNLSEAYAALGREEEARWHWRAGYALAEKHGLGDLLSDFQELRQRLAMPEDAASAAAAPPGNVAAPARRNADPEAGLLPEHSAALALAREHGSVTARALMECCALAKPTATRRLADLARRGLLVKEGHGRGVRYTLPGE